MVTGSRWNGFRNAAIEMSVVFAAMVLAACNGSERPGTPTAASTRAALVVGPSANGPTCSSTDIHAKHQAAGFACTACHPCGGQYGFTDVYTFPSGNTSTSGGTITPGTATTPTSCTVACHYPLGTPPHSISWSAGELPCTSCHATTALVAQHPAMSPDATRADCQVCHIMTSHTSGTPKLFGHDPATWMDASSPGFHAATANADIAYCQKCHLPDLTGGITGVACAQCHDQTLPPGVNTWKQNCFMCHGDNVTYANGGAPPRATWGQGSDANRVGAHTSHLAGSAIAPPFDCGVCHVKPADALSIGHIDGPTATVTFAGLAIPPGNTTVPTWDRSTGTCRSTYCHGGTLPGGTNTTPIWTAVGQGQADCGACHGVPPPAPHPDIATPNGDLAGCNPCHPQTIDVGGTLIPPSGGGKHLDGMVEALGHDRTWMDTTSANFHAYSADRTLGNCTGCHGPDLSGGLVQVPCGKCHDQNLPPGVTTWRQNCFMCHGDDVSYAFAGAPPRTTWGNSGDPIRSAPRHGPHLSGRIAVTFDCGVCHVKPTDALSPGHVDDSVATVTFADIATTQGVRPFWNRATATCSTTYCHGSYSGVFTYTAWDWGADAPIAVDIPYAGKAAAPSWLDGAMTCDSCHGGPPQNGAWHAGHVLTDGCQRCHPDASGGNYVDSTRTTTYPLTITQPALHVNGNVEITPIFERRCFSCH